jgi:hypothetical protein
LAAAWVDSIPSVDGGRINVVKKDFGVAVGPVDAIAHERPVCVPHTTEGYTLPYYTVGAPHVDVGPFERGGRIFTRQLVAFGQTATALRNESGGIETNRRVICQIEQVAFTSRDLWLPNAEMQVIMASWAEFLDKEFGVPQRYPYDPKDMEGGTWAVETNPWRRRGLFATTAGWHPHAAIPENEHWDCGGENIPAILSRAATPQMQRAFQLVAVWSHKHRENADPHRHNRPVSPHFYSKELLRDWLVRPDADGVRNDVFDHLEKGRKLYIAERRVEVDKIRTKVAA